MITVIPRGYTVPDGVKILPKQAFINAQFQQQSAAGPGGIDMHNSGIVSIDHDYFRDLSYVTQSSNRAIDLSGNKIASLSDLHTVMSAIHDASITNCVISLNGGTMAFIPDDDTYLATLIDDGNTVNYNGNAPSNTVTPTIDTPFIGLPCHCAHGTWVGFPASYGYQWQISDDGSTGWTDIMGETSADYTPVSGDLTKFLQCLVMAANPNGTGGPVASDPASAVAAPSFPPGAVAYWKMDEVSGDRLDATGNGNTLTDNGGTVGISGLINNAASFDGSGATNLTNSSISVGQTYSISLWFKAADGTSTGEYPVAFQTGLTSGADVGLVLGDNNANNQWIYAGDGANNIGQFQSAAYGVWHHVVVVSTPTQLKYYLDGVLIATGNITFDRSFVGFKIGDSNAGGGAINSLVDEVGVFNVELSSDNVALLFNAGAGFPYP